MRRGYQASLAGLLAALAACNALTGAGDLGVSEDPSCEGCGPDGGTAPSEAAADTTTPEPPAGTPGGFLDPTFGDNGVRATTLMDSAERCAVQPDGKIAVVGSADFDLAALRLLSTGTLDTSFAGDGRARLQPNARSHGFHVGADGANRMLVFGHAGVDGPPVDEDFYVARFNASGMLDVGFGSGGPTRLAGGLTDVATSFAVADVGLFVGGSADGSFALWKLSSNGIHDAAWGGGPRVTLPIPGAISSVAVVGASLLVTGPDFYAAGTRFRVAKVTQADGALVPAFGEGGIAEIDLGTTDDDLFVMRVQPDGKIVVVGETITNETRITSRIVVLRLLADGAPDPSFGNAGIATFAFDQGLTADRLEFRGRDMVLQTDGKIVIAGFALEHLPGVEPARSHVITARLLPDGTLDPLYGAGGVFRFSDPAARYQANGLALQPDGKIIVCGNITGDEDVFVARIVL